MLGALRGWRWVVWLQQNTNENEIIKQVFWFRLRLEHKIAMLAKSSLFTIEVGLTKTVRLVCVHTLKATIVQLITTVGTQTTKQQIHSFDKKAGPHQELHTPTHHSSYCTTRKMRSFQKMRLLAEL
jgi:hypothetical protein